MLILFVFGTQNVARAEEDLQRLQDCVTISTPALVNAIGHNNRGVEFGLQSLWPQAIEEAELSVKDAPENIHFRMNASSAYSLFGVALTKQSKNAEAIANFHFSLFMDKDNALATKELDKCLRLGGKDPDDTACRRTLAEQAEKISSFREAVVEYRACAAKDDSAENNYCLGRCLMQAGELSKAHIILQKALKLNWSDDLPDKEKCHKLLDQLEHENSSKQES